MWRGPTCAYVCFSTSATTVPRFSGASEGVVALAGYLMAAEAIASTPAAGSVLVTANDQVAKARPVRYAG